MKYKKRDKVVFRIRVGDQILLIKGVILMPWHTTNVRGDHYVVDSLPESGTWLKKPIVVSESNLMPLPEFKGAGKSFKEIINDLKVM